MEIKIYLSLIEAEKLIFEHIVILPKERLSIKQAQKDLSLYCELLESELITMNQNLILLSAAISNFNIPAKEETLFLNHYRVPSGMITTSDRNYRESDEHSKEIPFPDNLELSKDRIKDYSFFRKGLVACYHYFLSSSCSKYYPQSFFFEVINEKQEFTDFKVDFISAISSFELFPIKDRNDGKFYPEHIKRFNWWGAYLLENKVKSEKEALSEEDISEVRNWLLLFKNKEDFSSIAEAIKNLPSVFFKDFEFIIGYYLAASFYEQLAFETIEFEKLHELLDTLRLNSNSKLIFWLLFFLSLYKEDFNYLYVIPSLRKNLLSIERMVLSIHVPDDDLTLDTDRISLVDIPKAEAIAEYNHLINGGKLALPEFINKETIQDLFVTTFSNKNIDNIGWEMEFTKNNPTIFSNQCSVQNGNFSLDLSSRPNEIQFYVDEKSNSNEWLRELKIKVKPKGKSIDSDKKVLVGFFKKETYEQGSFKVYEELMTNLNKKKHNIKKTVLVWLVNEETEVVQSSKFEMEKKELKTYLSSKFGKDCLLLVKNENQLKEGEIKRNLKHSLGAFKIKNMEVINENLDFQKMNWLLSVSNEYVIETEFNDYFTLIN